MAAWQSAAIALAIGLLIGSERERNGGPALAGVRTFALAGLSGALAALVSPLVLAALVAAAAVIMAAGHLWPVVGGREESDDTEPRRGRLGSATEVALVLTVVVGGLAVTLPALAAAAGVATAVVLQAKDRLHHFVRDKVTELELGDALKFFVAAFIVLPLMPQANLGPYGVVDPRRMWTFVVAVTALGWLGYVAVRVAGPSRGLPAAGLAGGFVSGAATTGAMARTSRDPALFRPAMAAALLASVATMIQLVLVTAVADSRVAGLLIPAVALGSAVLVAEAGWLVLRRGRTADSAATVPARAGEFTLERDRADRSDSADEPGADDESGWDDEREWDEGRELARERERVADRQPPAEVAVVRGGSVTAIHFGTPVPRSAPSDLDDPRVVHDVEQDWAHGHSADLPEAERDRPRPNDAAPGRPDLDQAEPDRSDPEPARRDRAGVDRNGADAKPRRPRALVGRRPFDLIPALILTVILTGFLVLAALAEHVFGPGAAVATIAAAGLADSHAGALTAANLSSQSTLTPETAVLAAIAALAANTVVKLILAHVAGGRRASGTLAALFVGPALAVALGVVITLGVAG